MKGLKSRRVGAIDLQESALFYKNVFGFELSGPVEELSGPDLDSSWESSNTRALAQRIENAHGDVIELIQFQSPGFSEEPKVSTIGHYGLTHLAFFVGDLDAARERIIAAKGTSLDHTRVAMIQDWSGMYIADPNGTRIEIVGGPGVEPSFSHSGICVKDLRKSIDFYRTLGFEPAESYDMRKPHDWMSQLNEIKGITLFAQMVTDPQGRKLQLLDIVTPQLQDESKVKPFNSPGFIGLEVFANDQRDIKAPDGVRIKASK